MNFRLLQKQYLLLSRVVRHLHMCFDEFSMDHFGRENEFVVFIHLSGTRRTAFRSTICDRHLLIENLLTIRRGHFVQQRGNMGRENIGREGISPSREQ
jgi:hypothetical protein